MFIITEMLFSIVLGWQLNLTPQMQKYEFKICFISINGLWCRSLTSVPFVIRYISTIYFYIGDSQLAVTHRHVRRPQPRDGAAFVARMRSEKVAVKK